MKRGFTLAGPRVAIAAAVVLAVVARNAKADVVTPGSRKVEAHVVLLADRFDEYCEHRVTIANGDTFEGIALREYGDRARAKEIADANPTLDATALPVGAKVLVPPKKTPPADAKETLAWEFFGWCSISGSLPFQRVYPGEETARTSGYFRLVAVPKERSAEFARFLKTQQGSIPDGNGGWYEKLFQQPSWILPAVGGRVEESINANSPAVEQIARLRIVTLDPTAKDLKHRFVVEALEPSFRYPIALLGLLFGGGALGLTWMRRHRPRKSASR